MSDMVIYNDGELELDVSVDNETVWLNRSQISQLMGRDIKTIGKHINNVFKEKELEKDSTIANFATVQNEGGRDVTRDIEYYNLDVVISVGYRVKSQKGVKFRQWATSVLKSYITDGYNINTNKISLKRFENLELDMFELKKNLISTNNKLDAMHKKQLKPNHGIFYDGQMFDAYNFISDILRTAKKSIILIDNYVDDTTLTLFSKMPEIDVIIYTNTITKQLKLDFEKYNKQYKNITLKTFKNSHDRFLILDDKEVYLIGASLKDLGQKWFGFSKLDISIIDGMLKKLP